MSPFKHIILTQLPGQLAEAGEGGGVQLGLVAVGLDHALCCREVQLDRDFVLPSVFTRVRHLAQCIDRSRVGIAVLVLQPNGPVGEVVA